VNPRGGRKPLPVPADEQWPDIHDHSAQLADAEIHEDDADGCA